MLGETISHYRILEKLGQGGMGEVYLAEDIRLGHSVAIKKLPHHLATDRQLRIRFQREAKAVANLRLCVYSGLSVQGTREGLGCPSTSGYPVWRQRR